jgi:glycosyltransferase involved in cell wall biosynthesis
VTSDLYPDIVGGIGIHAHEMSRIQAKSGHDVTVFTSLCDGNSEFEERDGYRIIRFKNLFKLLGNSVSFSLISKLKNERNNYDIIHAHSHLFFSTNICALLRKFGSSPLVITNHGLISQTAPMWIQKIYIPTIAKWTYNASDAIICYTDSEKNNLVELGIRPDKINVIHNGIDTNLFSPSGKKDGNIQILWIGRFTPGKGVEYLIEGFRLILDSFPDAKLLMIGRGPDRDDAIKKINELGLSENIEIRDFVSNSELPEIYQQSDVFVLPSLSEGIPRTILESMSSGIPVICTELPQLVDIVEGCGLLVPVRDSKAISDSVCLILSDKIRAKEMGKKGRDKLVNNFSWDDTVGKTLNLYEGLI